MADSFHKNDDLVDKNADFCEQAGGARDHLQRSIDGKIFVVLLKPFGLCIENVGLCSTHQGSVTVTGQSLLRISH